MITALIIDDEENNRKVLRTLMGTYFPSVQILDEAGNAEEAYSKITMLHPQLIFLDIRMPGRSGFDLLRQFTEITFEIIFVTAFNKYAIQAFEFNALGYLLKPIDIPRLIKTVEKAKEIIDSGSANDVVLHFIKTLSDKSEIVSRFSVHHGGKVIFIEIADISFIEAREHNTVLTLADNSHYYSSKELIKYESVLEDAGNFIRINKSVIVNTNYLKNYSKGEPCILELKTGQSFELSRRRKAEVLRKLNCF